MFPGNTNPEGIPSATEADSLPALEGWQESAIRDVRLRELGRAFAEIDRNGITSIPDSELTALVAEVNLNNTPIDPNILLWMGTNDLENRFGYSNQDAVSGYLHLEYYRMNKQNELRRNQEAVHPTYTTRLAPFWLRYTLASANPEVYSFTGMDIATELATIAENDRENLARLYLADLIDFIIQNNTLQIEDISINPNNEDIDSELLDTAVYIAPKLYGEIDKLIQDSTDYSQIRQTLAELSKKVYSEFARLLRGKIILTKDAA